MNWKLFLKFNKIRDLLLLNLLRIRIRLLLTVPISAMSGFYRYLLAGRDLGKILVRFGSLSATPFTCLQESRALFKMIKLARYMKTSAEAAPNLYR